ncbi:MAG: hypothetical protein AB1505_14765 [Candidatus Latescibacterota bacterium]
MRVDSLEALQAAFAAWRSQKKHVRESMPEELVARAHRAAQKHGEPAVVRVTRVERGRLFRGPRAGTKPVPVTRKKAPAQPRSVPAFTRLELTAPGTPASPQPIAEVETGSGVRLRVFAPTPELLGLLSTVCGAGRVR